LRMLVQRSWKKMALDLVSALPGAVGCILVARWMISIKDVKFITDENIVSWPGTFYMRTYGKRSLETTGFALNVGSLTDAEIRTALEIGRASCRERVTRAGG